MVYRQTERSRQVREAKRRAILSAARALFLECGYGGTTIQAVVDAAGTSVGNFYFYFDNKAALFRAVAGGVLEAAWARSEEAIAEAPTGPARMAAMVYGNVVGLAQVDRALTRLVFAGEGDPAVADELVEINTQRVRAQLGLSFPEIPEETLGAVAHIWVGGGRQLLAHVVSDEPELNPLAAAGFLTRWNLRAVGVDAEEIEDAVAYAESHFAAELEPGGGPG